MTELLVGTRKVYSCSPVSPAARSRSGRPFAGGPVEYRHSSSAATRVGDVEP
jgi:hypothetical protein